MENIVLESLQNTSSSRLGNSAFIFPALTCFILFLVALLNSVKLKTFGRRIDKIPGPVSIPLLGTLALAQLPRTDLLLSLTKWSQKYKGCFRLWMLNKPMIVISKPEYVQKVVGSREHLDKADMVREVTRHMFGEGLITAKSSTWKVHRKLLTHSVNGKMPDVFLQICNKNLDIFQSILDKDSTIASADKFDSLSTSPIDLHPIINRLLFDITLETILGKSENALETATSKYIDAGIKNKALCSKRFVQPWLRWKWVWAIHPMRKDEDLVAHTIDDIIHAAISERRRIIQEADKDSIQLESRAGRGMIDTLLDAEKDQANQITDQYIKEEVLTFLIAAHDTTADTINWNLFVIANHVDEQEKIYEELVGIFGENNKDPHFTQEDIQKATYLDQCVKEACRIFPPVPLISRKLVHDVILEPDLVLPSGAEVWTAVHAVHHNPEIYPNPTVFDPDRFSPENCAMRSSASFIPFGYGPRSCIGKRTGDLGVKVVLASLLLNFSFVAVNKMDEVKGLPEITLTPSKPLLFYVKKR